MTETEEKVPVPVSCVCGHVCCPEKQSYARLDRFHGVVWKTHIGLVCGRKPTAVYSAPPNVSAAPLIRHIKGAGASSHLGLSHPAASLLIKPRNQLWPPETQKALVHQDRRRHSGLRRQLVRAAPPQARLFFPPL